MEAYSGNRIMDVICLDTYFDPFTINSNLRNKTIFVRNIYKAATLFSAVVVPFKFHSLSKKYIEISNQPKNYIKNISLFRR